MARKNISEATKAQVIADFNRLNGAKGGKKTLALHGVKHFVKISHRAAAARKREKK